MYERSPYKAGEYMCVIEIPAGMQGDLIDLVNRKTNGL